MEKFTIKSEARDKKQILASKVRKSGNIPAVLYGKHIKNLDLSVSAIEFKKLFKKAGESTIIELVTPDEKTVPVLIQSVQRNYLTSVVDHIDFYAVNMKEKLKSKVALEFTGESKAVKQLGGVLVRVLTEVEVECLPIDLPHNIEVDISKIEAFNQSLHVKDLQVSNKVTISAGEEEVVCKVQPPRTAEQIEIKHEEDVTKVEGTEEKKEGEEAEEDKKDEKDGEKKEEKPVEEKKEEPKKE